MKKEIDRWPERTRWNALDARLAAHYEKDQGLDRNAAAEAAADDLRQIARWFPGPWRRLNYAWSAERIADYFYAIIRHHQELHRKGAGVSMRRLIEDALEEHNLR